MECNKTMLVCKINGRCNLNKNKNMNKEKIETIVREIEESIVELRAELAVE